MTKSKKIRAYLAKHPDASAKDLQSKFNCSVSMAYRLIQESKAKKDSFDQFLENTLIELNLPQDEENMEVMAQMEADKQKPNTFEAFVPYVKPVDNVNHPAHYKVGGIETIDFIEAKGLDNHYHLANAIKYISRAPYKNNYLEDVKKAAWYLQREIDRHENIDLVRS